jgi:hypothetical protein
VHCIIERSLCVSWAGAIPFQDAFFNEEGKWEMHDSNGGSRYVLRDGDCFWVTPQDTRSTDIDCTDMTSAEFMAFFLARCQRVTRPDPAISAAGRKVSGYLT